ncbi:MAG TPA: hypothetical protein VF230_16645 [Acidimicrobiales bacterium]
MRRGCYPGSFDPLTVAHLAIAEAAVQQCALARLDLVLSRNALGKEAHASPLPERVAAIARAGATRPWLGVVVTDAQLLADLARGYDVLVVGADKWHQLHDVSFYGGSAEARDAAMARLPGVACAPRAGVAPPETPGITVLDLAPWVGAVSSTGARKGAVEWIAPEARDPES